MWIGFPIVSSSLIFKISVTNKLNWISFLCSFLPPSRSFLPFASLRTLFKAICQNSQGHWIVLYARQIEKWLTHNSQNPPILATHSNVVSRVAVNAINNNKSNSNKYKILITFYSSSICRLAKSKENILFCHSNFRQERDMSGKFHCRVN